ncbi:MAG TPA: type I methionyl aminopeptidase [Candidatus Absconditabacterales bacterium]|nr:type I methionyl aminopeptidase [Candidatus Absconditabacterales bacterium]
MAKGEIIIKTKEQIEKIRKSGQYLNELLYLIKDNCKAGISLLELEDIAQDFMDKNNLRGAFKGYGTFPANLCLSVNDCVVHGIPDDYVLKNGDLLKVDCGVVYKGGISDSAFAVVIGGEMANPLAHELTMVTKNALDLALEKVGPGKFIYDYSREVYNIVKNKGFNIIKSLTGHGVGVKVHEKPNIYNRPHPESKNIKFQPGMVVCFEPITAIESDEVVLKGNNDRNLYCKKGDIGSHWEYMVLITEDGYEILSGIV